VETSFSTGHDNYDMKRIIIFISVLILSLTCFSQVNKNEFYNNHWTNKPSACVHFFNNNQFVGLLMDGNKLKLIYPYLKENIESITKMNFDSNLFDIEIDSMLIFTFEKSLKDTLSKNDSLLIFPPNLSIDSYYRQYFILNYNGINYVFIGFHINSDNIKDGTYYYNSTDSLRVQLNDFQLMLDSRRFIYQHYKWIINDIQFYVLYNIESKKMKFFRSKFW
jgi:hypothetical protein